MIKKAFIVFSALIFFGCSKTKTTGPATGLEENKSSPMQTEAEANNATKSVLVGLNGWIINNPFIYKGPSFGSELFLDENGDKLVIENGTEISVLDLYANGEIDVEVCSYEIQPFVFVEVKDSDFKAWISLENIAFDLKAGDLVFDEIKPKWNYIKALSLKAPEKLTDEETEYIKDFSERLIKRANAENNPKLTYMTMYFLLRLYRFNLLNENLNELKINPLELIPNFYRRTFADSEKYHNGSEILWEFSSWFNKYGADFTVDAYGNTPLMNAVINENLDAIDYLLEKGADKNKPNANGISPLQMAEKSSNSSVIAHIKNSYNYNDYADIIVKLSQSDKDSLGENFNMESVIYRQKEIHPSDNPYKHRVVKNCELTTASGEKIPLSPSESLNVIEKFNDEYCKIVGDTSFCYYLVKCLDSEHQATGILCGDCISNEGITFSKGAANTEKFFNAIIKQDDNNPYLLYELYDLVTGNKKTFIDDDGKHDFIKCPENSELSYNKIIEIDGKELGDFSYYNTTYFELGDGISSSLEILIHLIDGDSIYQCGSFSAFGNHNIIDSNKDMTKLYYDDCKVDYEGNVTEYRRTFSRQEGSFKYIEK